MGSSAPRSRLRARPVPHHRFGPSSIPPPMLPANRRPPRSRRALDAGEVLGALEGGIAPQRPPRSRRRRSVGVAGRPALRLGRGPLPPSHAVPGGVLVRRAPPLALRRPPPPFAAVARVGDRRRTHPGRLRRRDVPSGPGGMCHPADARRAPDPDNPVHEGSALYGRSAGSGDRHDGRRPCVVVPPPSPTRPCIPPGRRPPSAPPRVPGRRRAPGRRRGGGGR